MWFETTTESLALPPSQSRIPAGQPGKVSKQTKPIPVRLTGSSVSSSQVQVAWLLTGSIGPQSKAKPPLSGKVMNGVPRAVLRAAPLLAMQRVG